MPTRKSAGRKLPPRADADDPERQERALFTLLGGAPGGFRLSLAAYVSPIQRDRIIDRLRSQLAPAGVAVQSLDLSDADTSLGLLRPLREFVAKHPIEPGRRRAVMIQHLESHDRPEAGDDRAAYQRYAQANLEREALSAEFPLDLVLWLTPMGLAQFGRHAPDLWHWRAATFEFAPTAQQAGDKVRSELSRELERAGRTIGVKRARERLVVLRQLLFEAEQTPDAESRAGLASRGSLHLEIGRLRAAVGERDGAREHFKSALDLLRRSGDPFANSPLMDLGDLAVADGQLEEALRLYEEANQALVTAVRSSPDDLSLQRDLSVSWERIGDVRMAQGDLAGALSAYEDGLEIAQKLAARDPSQTEWQRDLSVSWERIGDVRVAQGDLSGALSAYADGLEIRKKLAARDPSQTEWQRDLSVSWNKIGDVRLAQGDLAGALSAYADGLEIRKKLAARDPSQTQWQRDLSVSWNKIGDVRRAQGDLAGALSAYADGLEIAQKLAARDPTQTEWQRDLSVSWNKIGDVRRAQGDLSGARKHYERALEIIEPLAKKDPSNAQWRSDLEWVRARLDENAP